MKALLIVSAALMVGSFLTVALYMIAGAVTAVIRFLGDLNWDERKKTALVVWICAVGVCLFAFALP